MRRFAIAALAALLAGGAFAQSAAASPVGRWSISAARDDDQSHVQLRIDYSDSSNGNSWNLSWSSPVALSDVGLPADRLRGPVGPVMFRIQREPGSFDCTGSAGEGSGAGQFRYESSARFDDALAWRGLSRPTFQQSLELAIAGTTLAFVDQLRGSSQHPTTADIVRAVQHGVNPNYIAEMRAAGVTKVTAGQLVTLRDHGVTPRYIGDLAAAGYKNLGTDDLVALRDHGVSVAFVDRLKSHGYANLSVRDLIRLRDSGI
ncbi:MAG TPA: hypothetical protein VGU66_14265 [Candidatus Elarobacter sp.]|nr:hypothetical protein [Candidatus Elarobacter sp.]